MPETFEELSRKVVTSFLQSVVVVDDLASMRHEVGALPHPLVTPTREAIGVSIPSSTDTNSEEYKRHELNATLSINAFAEKGLICGVIKPEPGEPFEDKAIKAALRADITVFDWQLRIGDDGQDNDPTNIIKKIIDLEKSQNRIRLISIYSAENPANIKDKIREILGPLGPFETEDNDYTFIQNALRIAIFAKDGVIGAEPSRTVKEDELPDKLIGEFTKMTMGLLSNAALESLAALRLNTHRILGKLPSDLDAPYLTNRALLANPEEAEEYLTDLISEELQSIIEEMNIGSKSANIDTITKWLKAKSDAGKSYILKNAKGGNSANEPFTYEELNDLLDKGKEQWKSKNKVSPKIMQDLALTDMFHCSEETCKSLDEKYVFAATMRSSYGSGKPKLKFGTIVMKPSSEPFYFVCIQQPCDCIIRTNKTKRNFVFFPLYKSTDKYFQIIIKEANEYNRFKCSESAYDIISIEFTFPEEFRGLIEAEEIDAQLCFKDSEGNKLIWLGELKTQFARRILHTVAAKLTRADVNDPEWLRLHSNKVSYD